MNGALRATRRVALESRMPGDSSGLWLDQEFADRRDDPQVPDRGELRVDHLFQSHRLTLASKDVCWADQAGTPQTPMASKGSFSGSIIGSKYCTHC